MAKFDLDDKVEEEVEIMVLQGAVDMLYEVCEEIYGRFGEEYESGDQISAELKNKLNN